MNIESAQLNQDILKGLQIGNESLKRLNSIMSVEAVEALLDETQDAIEQQREIDALLAGNVSANFDEELENELAQLVAESGGKSVETCVVPTIDAPRVTVVADVFQPAKLANDDDLLHELAQIPPVHSISPPSPNAEPVASSSSTSAASPAYDSQLKELESLNAPSHKVVVSESVGVELAE